MISSIHENVTPSMLPPMISYHPLLLRAVFLRRPLFFPSHRAVIHFTHLSKCNCCQQMMPPGFFFTLPSHVKNMPPHGSMSLLSCLMFSLLYDIFLILRLSRLLHRELCVTALVQHKLLKHEGTRLAGSLLREDFYAHSPRPNVDNGNITSKPQKAIIINQPFSSVFKG